MTNQSGSSGPSGSSGAPSCPPQLQSKHGLQPASSPRTTETNRRRLGNLLSSITGAGGSGASSPGILRRFRSASISTDSPGMRAGSHGSSGRTTPSRDRDRHSDLDLDLDAASARARDGDGGGEGEKSAPPDLEVGGMSAASGGREYDPHTPSRSKLWSWFTPTKRAEDGDDDESEEWDEGCFVDAQAYLSDEHDEHDEHDDHYGTFISRLPDELLIQIFLHLPPTHTQLHTLSAVSHLWHELSFSPLLWSRAFHSSPGFALTPEASARGVATTMPPPGKWDRLVWDRQAEGSSTSTRESKVVEKNSAGSHGERGWFGTRRHLQPNILGRSPTIPTSPDPSTSPRHASESAPTFPNSNTIIPQTRPGHTQPIHYPTLYRSRVALPHHIRNPTGSHSAHISTLTHHTDSVYCLQSSGRWMITGSRDRTVRLWRLAEIDEHGAIGETELLCVVSDAHGGSVLSLDFEVEAGDEDGGDGKGRGKMITGSSDTTAGVWRINWGDDGRGTLSRGSDSVSGTGGSTQKQANVDQPSVERIGTLRGHTGGVLDVLMGARHYVTCSKDATIRIYDRDDYSFLRSIAAHEGPVNCLARNPDREVEQVVSASGDGTWVVWGLETGEAVRNGGGDGRGLACVVWEDDYIVTGDNDRLVKLFSASSTELLRTFEGHTDLVRTVSVNVVDGLLVSGGYDRTIRMWDLHTGQLIRKLATTHTSLVFDIQLTATRLFSASHDNSVQVVTFGTGLPYLGLFA